MKRTYIFLLTMMLTVTAWGQTLSVRVGSVTYLFPAAQTGDMTFADGNSLTVMGRSFDLADIDAMSVDDTEVTDNCVNVVYDGSSASVRIAGNVARYVEASVSGAHVVISQTNTEAVDENEITYVMSGSSTNGSLVLDGSYKCTVQLAGVTLTNPSGAVINISNSKRIQLSAKKETVNTLTDGSGSQKACIYSKGQLQLQGNGTLNIVGNCKHGIKSASYISVKNLTLNITAAVSDGISCEEYFLMKSGTVAISGVGDDGIQCDLGGTASTGVTTDHEDEDTGNVYLEGGSLSVTATGTATKCVKCDGSVSVTGGEVTMNVKGGIDTSDTTDLSYASGFKADGDFTQSGGSIVIDVTGTSGRGIGVNGTFTSASGSTGTLTITNSGALSSSGSTYFATAKGIKANVVAIDGGTIDVTMSGQASKGIKSDEDDGDGSMSITGGVVTVTNSGAGGYDGVDKDAKGAGCLKADKNMTISGGTLTLKATGTGGKCIKADGTLTVAGGSVSATTTGSQYKYSSNVTASPKAIKSTGAMVISGGSVVATSANHEGIESKGSLTVTGGSVYGAGGNDGINSAGDMYLKGGYVFARTTGTGTGADGFDTNGNLYVQGATAFGISHGNPDVAFDANTESGKKLYVQSGNLVAIGGLENGATLSQSCYSTSSYTKGAWYGLYSGSTLVLAFQIPSTGTMGSNLIVSTAGTASLKKGVTVNGGTSIWDGLGYADATVSGGSTVSLSSYSGGGSGPGGGPGGGGPGGW
ncbi:MAG: carbohydrate-binding domain-containing protein [Bacteroidaceae bacterium]|nr:carbohydrate-binding domain-containing protein [Bacteroidaceae bacterium]